MRKIGVYDSGCGGLSILNQLIKESFHGTIYYYADSLNNPWGNKSELELKIILSKISDWFKKKNVDTIISGCNTTYSLFKEDLNKIFNMPIQNILSGTEASYEHDDYTALCTENSYHSDLFTTLLPNKKIEEMACPMLANEIEKNNNSQSIKLISNYISKAASKNIILGCTHYALLKPQLIQQFPNHTFIDPAEHFHLRKETKQSPDLTSLKKPTIYFKVTGDQGTFLTNTNNYLITKNILIEKEDPTTQNIQTH